MPSRRRIGAFGSIFENHAIVAQENTMHGAWTQCGLYVKLDQAQSQGMVSLRLMADFNEVDAKHVTLWLSPENFQRLEAGFDPEKIPLSIKQHLSRNVSFQSYDQILILSLALNTPGRLILPHNASVLTPVSEHQTRARNFQSLCRSTRLLLYIPTSILPETRRTALEQFIGLGATGTLTPLLTDFSRIQRRRGGREATWEIFNIPESPPSYEQQAERATAKQSPANETGAFQKRLAGDFGAVSPGAPVYVSNSDSDTDFSHLLLSPLRPSHAATSPHSGSAQPAAAAHSAPQGKLLQEALRAELNATLPGMMREMLPGVLHEMLPELVRAQLRNLLPGALNEVLLPAEDSSESTSFVDRVIEPLVIQHLPQAVRDYIELEDPLQNYTSAADVAIEETAEDVKLEINLLKEESLKEIEQAEINVVERLTGVDWNVIGKEIMGLTPSQESYGKQLRGGSRKSALRHEHPEQDADREKVEDQGPGEHSGMEDRIFTHEVQEGNRLFSRTGLRYGSQTTTADETEGGSPGQPSPEALHVRSESSYGSSNTTRQNSRTSSPDPQAPASDRSVQPIQNGNQVGLNIGSRRNSNDNIDVGEVDRDEREDHGENEGRPGTQQGGLFGMAWGDSWMYGTTEPDTESDPSRTG
ncbi:hypothetical protein B0J12DRAFT_732523 [Macrophomina phaseolina]|uniref:Uncharacterized protein n=1 Tax=Macrophomina phaseolina TaxID=35725 RepID=A0ABQ8FVG1_9PEZI|nr:hypothetical protein B0J12DRAFT_732523 [Macrophomina phaseolina]